MQKNMEEPNILKSEVISTLSKMNRNKAAKPDGIVTEMQAALLDFSINQITNLIN